jgi:hypothetical protein
MTKKKRSIINVGIRRKERVREIREELDKIKKKRTRNVGVGRKDERN